MTIGQIGFEGYVTTRHGCQTIAIRESWHALPKNVITLTFRLVLFTLQTILADYQNSTSSNRSTSVNSEIAFLLSCCLGLTQRTFINGLRRYTEKRIGVSHPHLISASEVDFKDIMRL